MPSAARSLRALVVLALIAVPTAAQCSNAWLPGGMAGVLGSVHAATTWDPDGAGPLLPRTVVVGDFQYAGTVVANGVAAYEPTTGAWSAFGAGFAGGFVWSVAVTPTNDLVVGGFFAASGATPLANVARWSGTAWAPLGSGVDNAVNALAVLPNGDLVAAGMFATAGGAPASRIAAWNGSAWSPLGQGLTGQQAVVYALAVLPSGALVAGGAFAAAGGVPASGIAAWNGSAWSALGSGIPTGHVINALAAAPNGDVIAGGAFAVIGGIPVSRVARWNGAAWSALGSGVQQHVCGLHLEANGNLLAVGAVQGVAGATFVGAVGRWNGVAWSPVAGAPDPVVHCIAPMPSGDLLVGGDLEAAGGARGVAWLTPAGAWSAPSAGFGGSVHAVLHLRDGGIVVGGRFVRGPGGPVNNIARFDGAAWHPLGSGLDVEVRSLAELPNGDLVAAGSFAALGCVARWDGVAWSPLGGGIGGAGHANCVRVAANGDVLLAGAFAIVGGVTAYGAARWNGTAWSPLPGLAPLTTVWGIGELPTGAIVASGFLPGGVVVHGPGGWTPLGGGVGTGAQALAVTAGGEVFAGGVPGAAGIRRWNGVAWSVPGGGMDAIVTALAATPDGGVVATGNFTLAGGAPAAGLARWDGGAWRALDGGLGGAAPTGYAVAVAPSGEIAVGGAFASAGGVPSQNFARWAPGCPAAVAPAGAGCAGAGGANVLAARTAPWVGAPFVARATGMPPLGIVVVVVGLAPLATPLAAVLPQALPGCTLWVAPDLLTAQLPVAGAVDATLPLPASPALVGASFRQQVVALGTDAAGAILAVTATNALAATIGSY